MPGSRRRIEDEGAAAEVARAVASVRRAIGRLVGLLGQEEPAVYEGAILALHELGAAAVVGPLAAALPRAEGPRHRGLIVATLVSFAGDAKAPVARILQRALRRERDPSVALLIQRGLATAILAGLVPFEPPGQSTRQPDP